MATFGKYLVVDVVSLTDRGRVSTARSVQGGPAHFAVKQFTSAQAADPDEPRWDSQHFLDRARVQKSVVASGGRYWLPVYDMGLSPDGAWVVYDYVPLSAQKLIDGQLTIRPAGLYNLVNSVVKGLVELQQVRRRAHGRLKPGNVLISGEELADARILLSDPAQSATETESGDLYALGQLIHELVLHRPFTGKPWPLADNEEWHPLGKNADRWRELCSALLAPAAAVRPDLVDVARMLRDLSIKKKRMPRRYLVAPAAAACVAVGLLGLLAAQVSSARRDFARIQSEWVAPFAAAVSNPQRQLRFRQDPELKLALDDLDNSHIARLSTNGSAGSRFSLAELQRMRQATAAAHRVEAELSPDHWPRLQEIAALQRRYAARGWTQPADYLGGVISAVHPGSGASLADAIDRVLRLAPVLDEDQARVEEQWQQLSDYTKQLDQTHDSTLQSFARSLRASGAQSVRLSDGGYSGLDNLQALSGLAGRLADAVRPGWPANVDSVRLARDLGPGADHPSPQAMKLWLQKLPLYSVRKTETMLAAAGLQNRLKEAADRVARLSPDAAERAAFDRDRQEVQAEIDRFSKTSFIEKEVEEGALASRRDQLQGRIDALSRYAQPRSPADWLRSLPPVVAASASVNDYWSRWKQAQLQAAEKVKNNAAQLAAVKVRTQSLQTTLKEIDDRFPQPPADLSEPFRAVAQRHREKEIGKLLETIDRVSLDADPIRTASSIAGFGDWCAMLRDLSKDFPLRKEFLTPEDRPDEKWAIQDSFWTDPDVRQLVAPDLARLQKLRVLSSLSREELLKTALKSDVPEVAFEAWRLLGTPGVQPAWPADTRELAAERDVRTRVAGLIDSLRVPASKLAPAAALREQAPLRWRRVLESATSEATLRDAWAMRQAFDVDAAQLDALSPNARYNLWLWQVREDVEKSDDAALAQAIDHLKKAASELKDRPAAAALAEALSSRATSAPFADKNPGELFKVALLGAQPPIEFKRVEPQGRRPFYLATTEVSLGQFIAVVDAAGAWDACRSLPWPAEPAKPDLRRGPRVWEWTDGTPPRMAPAQLWLASESDNDFPIELRARRFNRMLLSDAAGGNPTAQHPMQQISADAALWFAGLCGCRLPTSQEWTDAYELYEKKGTSDQWNLRDRTWELQRGYVSTAFAAQQPAQWPDEGIFRPEGLALPAGREAHSRPDNDGALFFRPVAASGGSVFHHLIGTAAEYLCDAPRQFEELKDKRSPQSVRSFAEQVPQKLAVIGGSALSPPEIPVDKPLPLTHPDQGYADVGFRLAFTAPAKSLSEQVKWALQGQSYLWPQPATH